jgi:hypothetical protein
MAKYDGKNMAFKFGNFTFPAGSLISVDWPRSRAELDMTGATQLDKEFLPSERESTITVNAWDDVAETIRTAMEVTTAAATAEFYKQGNTTGKPKRTATAFVTSVSDPLTHNAGAPITIVLRVDGAVTPSLVSP